MFYAVEMRDPDFGDVLWNSPASALGAHNTIVSDSAPKQLARFAGALSIKHMLSGFVKEALRAVTASEQAKIREARERSGTVGCVP